MAFISEALILLIRRRIDSMRADIDYAMIRWLYFAAFHIIRDIDAARLGITDASYFDIKDAAMSPSLIFSFRFLSSDDDLRQIAITLSHNIRY